MQQILGELTRDERVMAAAACSADLGLLAETAEYPAVFDCKSLGGYVRTVSDSSTFAWTPWYTVTSLVGGNVQLSAALAAALEMSADEQRDRMRAMRALVAEFNVYRWAGRMIVDAARLRSRDRLTGRLTDRLVSAPVQAEP